MPHKGYKCTAKKKAEYCDKLRLGFRRGRAAEAVGLARSTIARALRADPEFIAAVDLAEIEACEPVEDVLYQLAMKGNIVAIQIWLYNRNPDRWRDQRNFGKPGELERMLQNESVRDGLRPNAADKLFSRRRNGQDGTSADA